MANNISHSPKWKRITICLLSSVPLIVLPMWCFAEATGKSTDNSIVFEVIQEQFILDQTTVKSAAYHQDDNGKYDGLTIILKETATEDFNKLTKDSIGKQANMVFNNKIISTATIRASLGNNFVLAGFPKEDADIFIQKLQTKKPDIVAEKN